MDASVDLSSPVSPSRQLVDRILDRVARDELGPGDRLPSIRALAADALVNPNTVAKAYRELERLGVVAARNGSGVFVRSEGVAVARDDRRRATAAALVDRVREARRAGHPPAEVRRLVEETLDDTVEVPS